MAVFSYGGLYYIDSKICFINLEAINMMNSEDREIKILLQYRWYDIDVRYQWAILFSILNGSYMI